MDGWSETAAAVADGDQNSFLFIGELARKTGADPKTIRFYEREELLSPPRHGRFRTYLASDVARLKNVLLLRRMGMPIARIREFFAAAGSTTDIFGSPAAVALLQSHLEMLRERQEEVTRQIEQTTGALERLSA